MEAPAPSRRTQRSASCLTFTQRYRALPGPRAYASIRRPSSCVRAPDKKMFSKANSRSWHVTPSDRPTSRPCLVMSTHAGGAFQELVFPDRDLVRMNIKQLRRLRQRLVALTAAKANFALNAGECVRRLFFIIFTPDSLRSRSPVAVRFAADRPHALIFQGGVQPLAVGVASQAESLPCASWRSRNSVSFKNSCASDS